MTSGAFSSPGASASPGRTASPGPSPSASHPGSDAGPSRRRKLWVAALFLLAIAVGTYLRLYDVADQIVADDEWHSLHMLLAAGYGDIFTHFGWCDHCIPLTLYDKLVSDTVGLSEWSMRAPMLFAGIGALILFPWLLGPYLGTKRTLVFEWLLAISPLHIYFSRYARPYSLVFFLIVLGTVAFARWWSSGRTAWAVVFALCAILAPWFHLAYLPFALAPFACVIVLGIRRARAEERPLATVVASDLRPGFAWLALAVAAGMCALLVPPIVTDWVAVATRSGHQRFELPSPIHVFGLLSGSTYPLLAFASGLAFLLGLVAMVAKQHAILGYFAAVLGLQVLALTISGPDMIDDAIVLVRYALPMLVVFLWITAMGLDHLDDLVRKEARRVPRHTASVALCAALLVFGPLKRTYHQPNNWTNHAMYQFDYSPRFERLYASTVLNVPAPLPIYVRIGLVDDPTIRIVEAPWNYAWTEIPHPIQQYIHKKQTLIGFVDDPERGPSRGELPFRDARFHFRNFVHVSDYEALQQKHVRFVIFHRDIKPSPSVDAALQAAAIEHRCHEYVERFGQPVYEDERCTVFDIERPK
jgi:hypothetical protein